MNAISNFSKISFPVYTEQLVTKTGIESDRWAVVRGDTKEIIGINTKDYSPKPYVDTMKMVNKALVDTKVDLKKAIVKDILLDNGGSLIREVRIPSISFQVTDPQDKLEFRLRVTTSYDGSKAFRILGGSFRLTCLNGMGNFIGTLLQTKRLHTKSLDVSLEGQRIINAVEGFQDMKPLFDQYARSKITMDQAVDVFQKTLAHEPKPHKPTHFNSTIVERLVEQYDKDSKQMGSNLWSAFNTATHWASHGVGSKRDKDAISIEREPMVQSMVTGKPWKALLAA